MKKENKNNKEVKKQNENIWTVPTFLNASRIVLAFVVIYMIFTKVNVKFIVFVFAIAAITDWFDGKIARRYKLVSEFGAKADMTADRFLWIGTALAFVIVYSADNQLTNIHGLQILLIMIREIISAPSALVALFSGKGYPKARYVAKVTTFVQGFALPALILSVFYPEWIFVSLPLSIVIGIVGTMSGFYYVYDVQSMQDKPTSKTKK